MFRLTAVVVLTLGLVIGSASSVSAKQVYKRSRVAAVVTLVAVNSAYAMVVSHNYRVAQSGK